MTSEFGEKRPDIGEQTPTAHLYRDLLLGATLHHPNRAIGDHVTAIDFSGPFTETADELNQLTQSDPQKREHGTIAYITPDRRILIRKEITQGDEFQVNLYAELQLHPAYLYLPKMDRQNRFVAALMHSHPFNTPPSPPDIAELLLSEREFLAHTSVFVATPERNILVFRGPTTPQLSQGELQTKMDLWYKEIEKRAKHFTTSDMTDAQELEIIQKAQNGMINTIIKKYGLRYFTSSLGQTIATLNPAGQL